MVPGSTFSPLGYRPYAIVWLSAMTSQFGNAIQGVGAQWLMTAIDGRADMVALIFTATTLPMVALALVGGAIADLYDKRKIMLSAQIGVAVASFMLGLLAWLGLATPWILILFTFLLGIGLAFFQPAMNASVPILVPRSEISGAIGLNVMGFNVARTLAPALGGIVVAVTGAFAAFIVSAVFFLLAAGVLFGWRPPQVQRTVSGLRGMLPAIAAGLRTMRGMPQLRAIAVRSFAFPACGAAAWGLMPLIARDLVGGGPERFGMLLGALGLGALLGSAASHEFRRRFRPEGLTRTAAVVLGAMTILIATRPGLSVTLAAIIVYGAFWVQALSGFGVSTQIWSPRLLLGRITSVMSIAVWGGLALGAWFWGYLAEHIGTALSIGISGAMLFAVAAIGFFMPLPRNDDAPDDTLPPTHHA